MDVIIMPTKEAACQLTARLIAEAIEKKPFFKLGLATGRTMERVYAILAEKCKAGTDFSLVRSFNLDEYVGMDGSDVNSYRYYMNYHLFNNIKLTSATRLCRTA